MVPPAEMRSWFGRVRSLRYAGITGGEALAGAVLLLGQREGLRVLVAGDGLSFLLSLVLLKIAIHGTKARAQPGGKGNATGSYRAAFADRRNVLLAALNVVSTLIITAPLLAMPVLVIQQLHLHTWLPGLLAALNTLAIVIPVFFAGQLLRDRPSLQVLARAAVLWAAGCASCAIAAAGGRFVYVFLATGMILLGFGEALYAPTADALPLELAPPDLAGRYTAVHQLAWGISGALAPVVAAWLLSHGRAPFWFVFSLMPLALAVTYTGVRLAGTVGSTNYGEPRPPVL